MKLFSVLFVLLCVAYLLLIPWTPSVPAAIVKVLPILMLVSRAATRAAGNRRIFLALGLSFSLAGDVTLALSPEKFFVLGVAAFMFAHIFYIVTFVRDMRYSNRSAALAACVIAWCAFVASIVVPELGTLRAPVAAYMVVIAAMGVSAAFATGAQLTLVIGASAFIISDSVIAVDRFITPLPSAAYVVMVTYYFGQFFIVQGVVRRPSPRGAAVVATR